MLTPEHEQRKSEVDKQRARNGKPPLPENRNRVLFIRMTVDLHNAIRVESNRSGESMNNAAIRLLRLGLLESPPGESDATADVQQPGS